MPEARYFLPDHPELKGDYSRDDLRLLLKSGQLSRSDMVVDDETGLAHLLGALLASPYYLSPHQRRRARGEEAEPGATLPIKEKPAGPAPLRTSAEPEPPAEEEDDHADAGLEEEEEEAEDEAGSHTEFRASSPLRQREKPFPLTPGAEDDELDDEEEEGQGSDDEEWEEEAEEDDDSPGHAGEKPLGIRVMPPVTVFQADAASEEELLFSGHPSWLSYPRSLFSFVALSGVAILCQRLHWGLEWCVTAAALALLSLAFVALSRMTTEYFITTRRVEVESGLIGRSTKEIRIADIRAIDVTQTGFNALLGVGNLDFFSSAGDEADVCFRNVYRPHRLKKTVRTLQG